MEVDRFINGGSSAGLQQYIWSIILCKTRNLSRHVCHVRLWTELPLLLLLYSTKSVNVGWGSACGTGQDTSKASTNMQHATPAQGKSHKHHITLTKTREREREFGSWQSMEATNPSACLPSTADRKRRPSSPCGFQEQSSPAPPPRSSIMDHGGGGNKPGRRWCVRQDSPATGRTLGRLFLVVVVVLHLPTWRPCSAPSIFVCAFVPSLRE